MPVISPGGRFSSAFPLWDGTGRILVTWSECRLQDTTGTILPCTAANLAAANAANATLTAAPVLYSAWMFDPVANTFKPIVTPTEGRVRHRHRRAAAAPGCRRHYIADSYTSDHADRWASSTSAASTTGTARPGAALALAASPPWRRPTADQRPARFLRLEKAVSIPEQADPQFRSSRPHSAPPATTCARSSATCRSSRTARCASRCRRMSPSRSRWSMPTRRTHLSAASRLAAAAARGGAQLQRLSSATGAAEPGGRRQLLFSWPPGHRSPSAWTGSTGDRPVPGHTGLVHHLPAAKPWPRRWWAGIAATRRLGQRGGDTERQRGVQRPVVRRRRRQ